MLNTTDMNTNNIDRIELSNIASRDQSSTLSIDDVSSVDRINSLTAQINKIEQQNRMMKLLALISICAMILIFLLSFIGLIASDVSRSRDDKWLLAKILKEMENYKKESKYEMKLEPEDLKRLPPKLEMHLRPF